VSIRETIFAAQDIPSEIVTVPEWNVDIEVRGMTGAERTRILEQAVDQNTGGINLQVVYPEIVIATSFDPETGERVFEAGDRDAILSKSGVAIDRVASPGMRLSGFSDGAADAAGEGSSDTPSEGSSTN
jgi:hypothetical protein